MSVVGLCRVLIVWFRNDLCLYDNEVLVLVSRDFFFILLVYCFDLRDYGNLLLGIDKNGFYWVKFFFECVVNLWLSLRERGLDLIVRIGKLEEVFFDLVKSVGVEFFYVY